MEYCVDNYVKLFAFAFTMCLQYLFRRSHSNGQLVTYEKSRCSSQTQAVQEHLGYVVQSVRV